MSIERHDIDDITTTRIGEPQWFSALVTETAEIDHTGVSAAVLSIRLRTEHDLDRKTVQALNLLRRMIRPTDRLGHPASSAFSVLLVPLESIADAAAHVNSLAQSLDMAGLDVSVGFAHRRAGESLLDTWARAEAEVDRATFRAETSAGLVLGE